MQIPLKDVSVGTISDNMLVDVFGTTYVQVHPTFLYESVLNLLLLILILVFRDKKSSRERHFADMVLDTEL